MSFDPKSLEHDIPLPQNDLTQTEMWFRETRLKTEAGPGIVNDMCPGANYGNCYHLKKRSPRGWLFPDVHALSGCGGYVFISKNPSLSVTALCFEKYSPQPDDPQHQLASSMIY